MIHININMIFYTHVEHVKGFSSKHIDTGSRCYRSEKIYCLQACPCIFQPGLFTGWGSEGLNTECVFLSAVSAPRI